MVGAGSVCAAANESAALEGGGGTAAGGRSCELIGCRAAGALANGSRDALWAKAKRRLWGGGGAWPDLLSQWGWSLRLQPGGREGG